ncbi:DUF4139 domain-containing protein [Desulfovulcanus sp.]
MCKKITVAAFICLCFAYKAFAKIKQVELYPNSALITECRYIDKTLKDRFTISYYANLESLRVKANNGLKLKDISWKQISKIDVDKIKTLKQKIKKLKQKQQEIIDNIKAYRDFISYWSKQKDHQHKTVKEIDDIGNTLLKKIKNAMHQISILNEQNRELSKHIEDLERELQSITGKTEKKWQIEAQFSVSGDSSVSDGKPAKVYYTYQVTNCGWNSVYTLNAFPSKSQINFSWDAKIRQNTGVDWDNVLMYLSTSRPTFRVNPPEMRDWIIAPRPVFESKKMAMEESLFRAAPPMLETVQENKVQKIQGYVYDKYKIGILSLGSGESRKTKIKNEIWPARFEYLVRPYLTNQAFLQARIKLKTAPNIPPGESFLMVDSNFIGKTRFSFFSSEKKIYLGNDPQIQINFQTNKKESGKTGFLGNKKSYEWLWTVNIKNNKKNVVEIIMEDVVPQKRDKRIEIEPKFEGIQSKQIQNKWRWNFSLGPGQGEKITYGYIVKYPKEMNILPGR